MLRKLYEGIFRIDVVVIYKDQNLPLSELVIAFHRFWANKYSTKDWLTFHLLILIRAIAMIKSKHARFLSTKIVALKDLYLKMNFR